MSTNKREKTKVIFRFLDETRYRSGAAKYRHPDLPNLTWSGHRGRKPKWLANLLKQGRQLSEFEVDDDDEKD